MKDKTRIIILLGILFLYNGFKFIGNEGNKSPILSTLFNMIIILFIILIVLHKNELNKKGIIKQTILDDYFTIK